MFYEKYCEMFMANTVILKKIKETVSHKEEILGKLKNRSTSDVSDVANSVAEYDDLSINSKKSEKSCNNNKTRIFEKSCKKRNRKLAGEVLREFACPVHKCKKKYGKKGTLTAHIKDKHQGYCESPMDNDDG